MADTVITKLAAAIILVNDGDTDQARIIVHEALELLGGDIDPVTEILKKISEVHRAVAPQPSMKYNDYTAQTEATRIGVGAAGNVVARGW